NERLAVWVQTAKDAAPRPDARSAQVGCLAFGATGLDFAGRYPEADSLLARAQEIAEGRPGIDAQASGGLHQTRALRATIADAPDAALPEIEAAVAAFELAGDRRNACVARANSGCLRAALGDFAGAEAALRATLAEAETLGMNEVVAGSWENLGHA